MKNKKLIWVFIAFAAVAVVIYRKRKSSDSDDLRDELDLQDDSSNETVVNNEPKSDAILSLESHLKRYNEMSDKAKGAVWVIMMVRTPYWSGFYKDSLKRHRDKHGADALGVSDFLFSLADQIVEAGANIHEKYAYSNRTYSEAMGTGELNSLGIIL